MTPEEITAGARTIVHLAGYFDELGQTVEKLLEDARASRRGYFTPSEEETVRRLQVSYWQSRGALFDVALSFRDDRELSETVRPEAFLVAYAAAVLLVHAARFLRESFEPLPAVRGKLNEPEPSFGIPQGMYDTVQKSLTSPRHAWHLYHAMRYFDEHERELRAKASDPLLAGVMSVIDRLGDRMRVPASRYVKARLKVRANRAIGRLQHGLLGRALYGIQKLAASMAEGVFTRPGHRPNLPEQVARDFRQLLEPGDVLITRKEYAVTNYFLPGYWKHAALYLGEPAVLEQLGLAEYDAVKPRWEKLLGGEALDRHRVLESLKDGVWIRSTASPFSADAVVAIRPRLTKADVAEALARGLFHEGKMYDFDFDFTRADRLVCTEVIYRSYDGIGGTSFELTPRAGRMTLAAVDLVSMALKHSCFDPLAVYMPGQGLQLARDEEAVRLLDQTRR